jgi:hypothetical protein
MHSSFVAEDKLDIMQGRAHENYIIGLQMKFALGMRP